ncbi:MAG: class I SAM-dependent methyltransferase [Candidatus Gracilibacteria bacterium]
MRTAMINKIRKIEMNVRYEKGLQLCKLWGNDFSIIKTYFDVVFQKDILGISKYLSSNANLTICDLGAGEGTITKHFLLHILHITKKAGATIHIDLIEPDIRAAYKLKICLRNLNKNKKITLNHYQMTAEEFLSNRTRKCCYDIVILSHSLYFINMRELPRILESVKPNGFLSVILGSERSWMSYFKDFFVKTPSVHGGTFKRAFDKCNKKREWKINHRMIQTYLDLKRIKWTAPQNINDISRNMMSLILQKNFDELTIPQLNAVYAAMRPHLNKKHMLLDGDYYLLRKKSV